MQGAKTFTPTFSPAILVSQYGRGEGVNFAVNFCNVFSQFRVAVAKQQIGILFLIK